MAGGKRPGAGRPRTGKKLYQYWLSEHEAKSVTELIHNMREENGHEKSEENGGKRSEQVAADIGSGQPGHARMVQPDDPRLRKTDNVDDDG